ncbi:DNA-processing protein DprA [Zavarzinia compransoris]|uniref:DNA-processing protein DprA n=1 Tax=Zavarzinia compransoris TaxID=1264899 RepID=UPI0010E846DB|nr:DNA-processing protein DprA [Zavarzinia compransoris]TDP43303.1 DNA processing protein [Zavarzinia compransoris]
MAERRFPRPEIIDRLRLIRTESVGPVAFEHLLDLYGSAGAALAALPDLARKGGRKSLRLPSKAEAEREIAAVEKAGAQLIAKGESDYPPLLAAIEAAPPLITAKGHLHLGRQPAVAMVGARNASAAGQRLAREIAGDLGRAGLVVVSGLARGIDGVAHLAALETGTIAVVAGGIDVVYPPEHAALQARIGEAGLVIAEMPPGTQPQARHFPRRNRLISGLALGVVVVEAALKSGSLITARFALEQGREVMAVPGSPLDPRARGANDLIRQGARLVESGAEVVEALRPMIGPPLTEPSGGDFAKPPMRRPDDAEIDRHRARVLDLLSPVPVPVDELLRQAELTPPVLFTILLELELAGRLLRHAGGRVSLI